MAVSYAESPAPGRAGHSENGPVGTNAEAELGRVAFRVRTIGSH